MKAYILWPLAIIAPVALGTAIFAFMLWAGKGDFGDGLAALFGLAVVVAFIAGIVFELANKKTKRRK